MPTAVAFDKATGSILRMLSATPSPNSLALPELLTCPFERCSWKRATAKLNVSSLILGRRGEGRVINATRTTTATTVETMAATRTRRPQDPPVTPADLLDQLPDVGVEALFSDGARISGREVAQPFGRSAAFGMVALSARIGMTRIALARPTSTSRAT